MKIFEMLNPSANKVAITAILFLFGGLLPLRAQEVSEAASRGRLLVQTHCAKCHAIGRSDLSANAAAPAFRLLARRYPPEALQEALAEGILVGHADMPEFEFRPKDVGDIIAYLKSIQLP